jgi:hypothetical protein
MVPPPAVAGLLRDSGCLAGDTDLELHRQADIDLAQEPEDLLHRVLIASHNGPPRS